MDLRLTRWHQLHTVALGFIGLVFFGAVGIEAQERVELIRLIGRTVEGTVISVADGDTVRVRLAIGGRSVSVRLEGIDSPELREAFGLQARNATRVTLFNKVVQLTPTDVDRYDRLVARVVVGGLDSSLKLVESGLACHYTRYSSDASLASAQRAAQNAGKGFWAVGAPKPACAKPIIQGQAIPLLPAPRPTTGPFHGNLQSRVYHAPGCPNYRCKNCTAIFNSADEAQKSGYRPAGDCLKTSR